MSEGKLPLVARKNIKEKEEKVNEDKEKIAKAVQLSSDISIDADYTNLHPFCDKAGYQNRVGECVQWYTEALGNNFTRHFADEQARSALQSAWTTGVIKIQTGTPKKGDNSYTTCDIENGDLVLTIYKVGNSGEAGNDLVGKLGDHSGLTLKAAQNLKSKEEERDTHFQKIHDGLGLNADITLDCDFVAFAAKVDESGYKDRLGEVINWYIEGLVTRLNNQYKNDIVKSGIVANWTTGVLRLEWGTLKKGENKYHETNIRDGDLVVTVYKTGNTGDTGSDLVDKLTDPDTTLTLKHAMNWKERKEAIDEFLQKIQDLLSLSTEVTLDVNLVEFAPKVDQSGYKDRIGEVVNWYVEGLYNKLNNQYKTDVAKQALASVWTTGVLRIEWGTAKKGDNRYSESNITNGDFVIIVYKSGNTGDVGNDLMDKLTDPDTTLTVKHAINWKERKETIDEFLQKIQDFVGLSTDVTLDLNLVEFAPKVDQSGYKDRIGEVVNWYVEGIHNKITNLFKQDIAKQALASAWTTGVLRIEWGTPKKGDSSYYETNINNGDLVATIYKTGNTGEVGSDLINKISEPNSNLPLKSALNIKEYEEKKEELLKAIQDAVGLSADVTLDVEWGVIDEFCNKEGYKNRCGEVMGWVIEGLKNNITKICKEELSKEAIGEVWTTGVIKLEENKKVSYHDVNFVNGDLVIQYNKLTSNTGNVGSDIEKKL